MRLQVAWRNDVPQRKSGRAALRVVPMTESLDRRLSRQAREFARRLLAVQEDLRRARPA